MKASFSFSFSFIINGVTVSEAPRNHLTFFSFSPSKSETPVYRHAHSLSKLCYLLFIQLLHILFQFNSQTIVVIISRKTHTAVAFFFCILLFLFFYNESNLFTFGVCSFDVKWEIFGLCFDKLLCRR